MDKARAKEEAAAKAEQDYQGATDNPAYTSQSKGSQLERMAQKALRRGNTEESKLLQQQAAYQRLKEPQGLLSDAQRKRELGRLNPESFDAEGNRKSQLMPTRDVPEPKKFSPLDLPFDNRLKFARDLSASKLITSGDFGAVGRALDRGAALGIDEEKILSHIQSLQSGGTSGTGEPEMGTTASGQPFGEIDLSLPSDASAAAATARANNAMPAAVAKPKSNPSVVVTDNRGHGSGIEETPIVGAPEQKATTTEETTATATPVINTGRVGQIAKGSQLTQEVMKGVSNSGVRRLLDKATSFAGGAAKATATKEGLLKELDLMQKGLGKWTAASPTSAPSTITLPQFEARTTQLAPEIAKAAGAESTAAKTAAKYEAAADYLKGFAGKNKVAAKGLDILKDAGVSAEALADAAKLISGGATLTETAIKLGLNPKAATALGYVAKAGGFAAGPLKFLGKANKALAPVLFVNETSRQLGGPSIQGAFNKAIGNKDDNYAENYRREIGDEAEAMAGKGIGERIISPILDYTGGAQTLGGNRELWQRVLDAQHYTAQDLEAAQAAKLTSRNKGDRFTEYRRSLMGDKEYAALPLAEKEKIARDLQQRDEQERTAKYLRSIK